MRALTHQAKRFIILLFTFELASMIKNYFKTAWRALWNNKFYSAINISGLAAGLAVGIMILLWVQHESNYDHFHKHAASIYKINSHLGTGSRPQVWEGSP